MSSSSRVVLWTGAPACAQLDFSNEDLLLDTFNVVFERYLGLGHKEGTPPPSSTTHFSKWRCVQWQNERIASAGQIAPTEAQFYDTLDVRLTLPEQCDRDEFLEYSTMVMDDLLENEYNSSRSTASDVDTTLLSLQSNGSFLEGSDGNFEQDEAFNEVAAQANPSIPANLIIADLSSIPSPTVLQRLHPQTVTVNLLVAVIKIEPTRTVRLRKRNVEMEIVELIIGDESRAGFTVSFWLEPEHPQRLATGVTDQVRQQLQSIRIGDIVCLRNVALTTYGQRVYGQSLNKRAFKVQTTITTCTHEEALTPTHRPKYRGVHAWRDMFVGALPQPDQSSRGNASKKRKHVDDVPPDTQ